LRVRVLLVPALQHRRGQQRLPLNFQPTHQWADGLYHTGLCNESAVLPAAPAHSPPSGSGVMGSIWQSSKRVANSVRITLRMVLLIELQNHRMAWVEKDHSAHPVPTPCYVQGRQPAAQAAQSHIQPGLECLQGGFFFFVFHINEFPADVTFLMCFHQ